MIDQKISLTRKPETVLILNRGLYTKEEERDVSSSNQSEKHEVGDSFFKKSGETEQLLNSIGFSWSHTLRRCCQGFQYQLRIKYIVS